MNIPQIGDIIPVKTDIFTGDVTVTYVDIPSLYVHHHHPIQCEISTADLEKLVDSNHGQSLIRVNLKEIVSNDVVPEEPVRFEGNVQGDLFEGF